MKYLWILWVVLLLTLSLMLVACGADSGRRQRLSQNSDGASSEMGEAASTESEVAAPVAESSGDPAAGQEKFPACAACHGPAGKGVPGLGKDMTTSEFIAGKTDDELVAFIKVGRDPSDPLNTTGVAMPPKGGNPTLNEQDLYNIVAYIRTLVE